MYYTATLTTRGRVTIPIEIVKKMGFKKGDKLLIDEESGRLKISKHNSIQKTK